MSGMEFNKIFAAILVAGITASLSGFIARETMEPHELAKDAVPIEGVEVVQGGPAKPAGPQPILAMLAGADPARGQKVAKACAACHIFDKGGPNATGPNLWGVVGRDKGSHPGFSYSDGMKSKEGVWDYESLNHFLYKPKAYIEGTKMTFVGLKKPEDRAAVIAWLRTLADSPKPLPTDAEIAAEQKELGGTGDEKAPAEDGKAPAK